MSAPATPFGFYRWLDQNAWNPAFFSKRHVGRLQSAHSLARHTSVLQDGDDGTCSAAELHNPLPMKSEGIAALSSRYGKVPADGRRRRGACAEFTRQIGPVAVFVVVRPFPRSYSPNESAEECVEPQMTADCHRFGGCVTAFKSAFCGWTSRWQWPTLGLRIRWKWCGNQCICANLWLPKISLVTRC